MGGGGGGQTVSRRIDGNRKTLILSRTVDQKSLRQCFRLQVVAPLTTNGSHTLFLSIFYPRSSIIKSVFDCRLPGVCLQRPSSDDKIRLHRKKRRNVSRFVPLVQDSQYVN